MCVYSSVGICPGVVSICFIESNHRNSPLNSLTCVCINNNYVQYIPSWSINLSPRSIIDRRHNSMRVWYDVCCRHSVSCQNRKYISLEIVWQLLFIHTSLRSFHVTNETMHFILPCHYFKPQADIIFTHCRYKDVYMLTIGKHNSLHN